MTDQPAKTPDPTVVYQWSCPMCESVSESIANGYKARLWARNDLASHIRNSDDGEHGTKGEIPIDLDARVLEECVKLDRIE